MNKLTVAEFADFINQLGPDALRRVAVEAITSDIAKKDPTDPVAVTGWALRLFADRDKIDGDGDDEGEDAVDDIVCAMRTLLLAPTAR